jgi:hypothetical protein
MQCGNSGPPRSRQSRWSPTCVYMIDLLTATLTGQRVVGPLVERALGATDLI